MAVCLALAGVGVALIAVRSQRDEVSDTQLATDSPQQRQLRDGWRELGTLAASYPPVVPTSAPSPVAPPPEAPSLSNAATAAAAGGSFEGSGGNAGNGGSSGNATPPQPSDNMQSALPAATPVAQATPVARAMPSASEPASLQGGVPATAAQTLNFSSQSALCGPNTCNLGEICCNISCGTCVAPGATCDQTHCDNAIQYPASQACGLTTCNIDSVCCNPSCGICAAPGDECSQRACG